MSTFNYTKMDHPFCFSRHTSNLSSVQHIHNHIISYYITSNTQDKYNYDLDEFLIFLHLENSLNLSNYRKTGCAFLQAEGSHRPHRAWSAERPYAFFNDLDEFNYALNDTQVNHGIFIY